MIKFISGSVGDKIRYLFRIKLLLKTILQRKVAQSSITKTVLTYYEDQSDIHKPPFDLYVCLLEFNVSLSQ